MAEVYESGSDSAKYDDLEHLLKMENPQKKKRLKKSEAAAGSSGGKAKLKVKSKLVEYFREAEVDEAELNGVASSDMFAGMEFYIVNTDERAASKHFLETVIATNGGRRVQNLMQTTTHLIAARADFRVRNIVAQYGMNVIHFSWVLSCLERGFLVDLEPMFMVSANIALQNYFDTTLDRFGDHLT